VRFVVDANLSPKVAGHLRDGGHDAVHVAEVDLLSASDSTIMEWARENRRVVVSNDTDFGTLLAQQGASEPSFVLFRQLQDRKADGLAALLLANLDAVTDDLLAGAVVTVTPRHLRVRPLPIRQAT
jgi:predicted nuclease of predicted toxin-antitoxin system